MTWLGACFFKLPQSKTTASISSADEQPREKYISADNVPTANVDGKNEYSASGSLATVSGYKTQSPSIAVETHAAHRTRTDTMEIKRVCTHGKEWYLSQETVERSDTKHEICNEESHSGNGLTRRSITERPCNKMTPNSSLEKKTTSFRAKSVMRRNFIMHDD